MQKPIYQQRKPETGADLLGFDPERKANAIMVGVFEPEKDTQSDDGKWDQIQRVFARQEIGNGALINDLINNKRQAPGAEKPKPQGKRIPNHKPPQILRQRAT